MNFIHDYPDLSLFSFFTLISVTVTVVAITLVKRFIPHDLRFRDNPVIGSIVSMICLMYGVLAGLIALYLINNIAYATNATQSEANAIASVFHTSQWLKDPVRKQVQNELSLYLQEIIDHEWPMMKEGKDPDRFGDNIIDKLFSKLHHYPTPTTIDALTLRDMINAIQTLYETRQDRIAASEDSLSMDVWVVILVGTILTILMSYLFAMNFYMHILTASATAIMCFTMVFLLISLDHPFQGDFVIEPNVYKPLLEHIKLEVKRGANM